MKVSVTRRSGRVLNKGDVVVVKSPYGLWSQAHETVGVFDGETKTCLWLKQGDVTVPVEKVGCDVKILAKGR